MLCSNRALHAPDQRRNRQLSDGELVDDEHRAAARAVGDHAEEDSCAAEGGGRRRRHFTEHCHLAVAPPRGAWLTEGVRPAACGVGAEEEEEGRRTE